MKKLLKAEFEIVKFDVCDVITASQLNNGGEGNTSDNPTIFSLTNSGLDQYK